jgi:homoserine kinase
MKPRSILVKVPATVGNFAGAMNCAAVTLDAMFNVKVTPRLDGRVGIRYFGENGDRIPRDRRNLVVRAMEAALHLNGLEFSGADFEVYSSVPVGVGMGSSTAAVLAGLIAADRLYSLQLNEKTLFELAQIYETRVDNLHAAWSGGFVACTGEASAQILRRTFVPGDFVLSVVTPELESCASATEGEDAAEAAEQDASLHFDRARTLAELFARPGRRGVAGLEPVRPHLSRKVVPGLEQALRVGVDGVMGIFVCGSGPGVGILSRQNPDRAIGAVRQCFLENGLASTYGLFRPTNMGAQELNAVRPHIAFPALRMTETLAGRTVS